MWSKLNKDIRYTVLIYFRKVFDILGNINGHLCFFWMASEPQVPDVGQLRWTCCQKQPLRQTDGQTSQHDKHQLSGKHREVFVGDGLLYRAVCHLRAWQTDCCNHTVMLLVQIHSAIVHEVTKRDASFKQQSHGDTNRSFIGQCFGKLSSLDIGDF